MAYTDTIRDISLDRIFNVVVLLLPVLDQEILGIVPVLRDFLPVEPIHLTKLSWTERGRLVVLILLPYVDGEWVELLTGRSVNEVIAD